MGKVFRRFGTLALLLSCLSSERLFAATFDFHLPAAQQRTLFDIPKLLRHAHYRFIPLPLIATDPAEGNTYGVLPVVIAVDEHDEIISIFANALTFNKITRYGGFGTWIFAPSRDEELRISGGAATQFYREAYANYFNRRWRGGRLHANGHFHYFENPFERFFGFGPGTPKAAESNFTSLLFRGSADASYNFVSRLSAVGQLEWLRMGLQARALPSLLDTTAAYGALPEVGSSNQMFYRLGFHWDSRDNAFIPTKGIYARAFGILSHEVTGSDAFFGGYELRFKLAAGPNRRFTTVASWRWQQLFGKRIPFTLQSTLGGDKELRGFVLRRFTDRHATVLDIEERILVHEWNLFSTKVGFGVAPFFSVGQVFHRLDDVRPRNLEPAGGIGFRMSAPPNVVGRVDVAYSRDGLAVYATLDYPF